ncbi:phosphoribosylformylglycinamidine synthase subunit PurQ [Azospirillum isscasi]|uniref:Phosphoribosylformylglycinamidine synthase subunit PurQ n=1 Tax=Azospirillum isscasi TaxID=3053926 RepID=A0ABU0WC29_9PROT|nr:phosphoribosylformylglycinamidine synthase subunit PurQ [Azospirillum isscasi]MDQ2101497.1 phosphoribosylformylglycinamidine synthase subunit PurQ [Azospirillum isscasi]
MKAAVIVFPGSNRERDAVAALEAASGTKPHLVWHRDTELPKVDLILVPGGFSYGDYLRSGAMAAHSPIMREVKARADQGVRVLGICNGFQIITEAGLLPGALMRNAKLKFICRTVHLRVENTDSPFTAKYRKGQIVRYPVAHGDGNYWTDAETVKRLDGEGQVAFRYVSDEGSADPRWNPNDWNPNGSLDSIAGIFNAKRTVLGLMPHPEDAVSAFHGNTDGKPMFDGLVEALS